MDGVNWTEEFVRKFDTATAWTSEVVSMEVSLAWVEVSEAVLRFAPRDLGVELVALVPELDIA